MSESLMIFEKMIGKTATKVTADDGDMRFNFNDGSVARFYHEQDCCESVAIEDISGDLRDLEDTPLLVAEEVSGTPPPCDPNYESQTWTFYKFATVKGSVSVRWLGSSNGYYSESVDFKFTKGPLSLLPPTLRPPSKS